VTVRELTCRGGCDGVETFIRAGGDCVCARCGKDYYHHPSCAQSELPEHMSSSGYREFILHVLCDGTHVKL
jgi:hypothetical protein